ncbi:MAG: hypothetical protein RL223_549 [Pseudomonadota bacterium]|jgi:hypothetical protein
MARYVQFIRVGKSGYFAVNAIARVVPIDDAVVIRDHKGKVLAWIEVYTEEQSNRVLEIFGEIINTPSRAQQPDLSFIVPPTEDAQATSTAVAARTATMPKRNTGTATSSATVAGEAAST